MVLPFDIKEVDEGIVKNWLHLSDNIKNFSSDKMDTMRKIQNQVQQMVDNQHIVSIALGDGNQQLIWQILNHYDKVINNAENI